MPPLIEQMGTSTATCIVIVAVLLYGWLTLTMLRKRPERLWIPALALLLVSIMFYWHVYDFAAAKAWFPKLVMAVMSAVDLFLFKFASSIGNLNHFFNLRGGVIAEGVVNPQAHLIILQGLYLCSIWTTSILLVHFLAGRLASRLWLLGHCRKAAEGRTHIFLGTGKKALAIAKSLPAADKVIFVEEPAKDELPGKVSILSLFRGVRAGSSGLERMLREAPHAVVLKARKTIAKSTEGPFFEELGLRRLSAWAGSSANCFYLLSDNTQENLSAVRRLLPINAQLFYHAKKEGTALKVDLASDSNIHIVDSSFLATNALNADDSLYPVRFVSIGRDKDGEPAGYVSSPFQAMVCGFGESGQGALAFLYEFGAFVGKDGQPSPFHCEVVDADMDRISVSYKASHPALDAGRVCFIQSETDSEAFRSLVAQRIESLNYVFISLGDDGTNVNLAVDILESAFKSRASLDGLIIVVKMEEPETYRDIISFYNGSYGGKEIIRTIGDIERTWTWDNISNEAYLRYARCFQASYSASAGDGISWDMREEQVRRKPGTELARRMELRRKTGQDFANYFHVRVKAALCPPRLWEGDCAARDIPVRYEGEHYTGSDEKAAKVLENLARLEHLRWTASHEIAGYQYGPQKREELMTHPDMRPYDALDGTTKHYDWIVVRTTLDILNAQK